MTTTKKSPYKAYNDAKAAGASPAEAAMAATAKLDDAIKRVLAVESTLNARYAERTDLARALTLAAVAGEHVCILGPPGAAKSAIVRDFCAMIDARYFEYLLTRFTEPNELFGPVDLAAFKRGEMKRCTAGMLPDCEVAFLDEAFKANSAILNALLTILNERRFHDGRAIITTPLRTALLASNEMPEEGPLAALWDRALMRLNVTYIKSEAALRALLFKPRPALPGTIASVDDYRTIAEHATNLPISARVEDALISIHAKLLEKGIIPSDRRKVQLIDLARSEAALTSASEVTEEHLECLRHVLWMRPEQIPVVDEIMAAHVAAWLQDVRRLSGTLDEIGTRLQTAMKLPRGDKRMECGKLTNMVGDAITEAEKVLAAHDRQETRNVIDRAKKLDEDITKAMMER